VAFHAENKEGVVDQKDEDAVKMARQREQLVPVTAPPGALDFAPCLDNVAKLPPGEPALVARGLQRAPSRLGF
jgi:hypothetical protein